MWGARGRYAMTSRRTPTRAVPRPTPFWQAEPKARPSESRVLLALERGQRKQTVQSPSRSSMTRITSACVALASQPVGAGGQSDGADSPACGRLSDSPRSG